MIKFIISIPAIVWFIIILVLVGTFWAAKQILCDFKTLLLTLEQLNDNLKKYKTQITIDEINEIEDLFTNLKFKNNYFLKDIWVEFDETIEKDIRNNKVYNTLQSEDFFNVQSIIVANLRHLEMVKATPAILTALGLLGTFLAILIGLFEVEVLKGGQVTGIEGLINGLAGKFTSSIVALGASIIITIIEKRYYSKLIRVCSDIQRSMNRIFPRRSTEKLLIQLLKHSEEQEAALKSFSTDMSGHLKAGIQDGISPLIEKLIFSMDEIKKEKQQSSASAISSMISDFKSSLTGAAGDEINNMATVLQNATSIMSNFANNNQELENRVNNLISILDETIKAQQRQFTDHVENVNSIINYQISNLKSLFNEIDEKMNQYRNLISTTKDLQNNLQIVAENLFNAGNNFASSANSFNEINSSIEQLRNLSEQDLQRFNESINQWNIQVNAIKEVENSIGNILEKVNEALVGYSEQTNNSLREYLAQYDEQMTNITKHFSSSIQEFDEKLDNLNDILGQKIEANK